MAKVELDSVNKYYPGRHGAVHAVQDLNLTVEDGEFVALLGPSGCGKTSTLRMIVGLEAISEGEIRLDGQRINQLSPEQRNVAMAFETYALYPSFSVAENLAFPLEVRGIPEPQRQAQVQHIAELLRITDILAEKPPALSGGQQQRVGLGRALIRDPAVLILDEVLSHIDAHLKFQMLFELKRIHQDLRRTTIFVTHDQVEALALADRVAVMSNAQLQQVGNRHQLYQNPVNKFVADFIGEPPTNFFQVRLRQTGNEVVLHSEHSNLLFHPEKLHGARLREHARHELVVGIRPQNLSLVPREGHGSLTAEVTINEYLGEQTILSLQQGKDLFRALVPPNVDLARGSPATLYYKPGDVMVFDRESERLLN